MSGVIATTGGMPCIEEWRNEPIAISAQPIMEEFLKLPEKVHNGN
jgi:hypothetical protein